MRHMRCIVRDMLITAGTWLGFGAFRFFREYAGGDWYLVRCVQLSMGDFWSRSRLVSCNARTLEVESYGTVKKDR